MPAKKKRKDAYRPVRPFLSRMFARPSLQLNVDVVDDVEEVLDDCDLSVDGVSGGILKWKKETVGNSL